MKPIPFTESQRIIHSNTNHLEDVRHQTREAFDAAAPVYDNEYEELPGIIRLRKITSQTFLTYFSPGDSLLELNCGTGTDALTLAGHGVKVLATDLSPLMIREAQKKIAASGAEDRVTTKVLAFDELGTLHGCSFDGAYSNLGGLNCTNDLSSIAASLASLIKPRGYFIAAIMPSFCLWETCASLARLKWRQALRRRNPQGSVASLHGGRVHTFYHNPRRVVQIFSPYFTIIELMALNVVTPPPNFTNAYRSLGRFINILENVDDMIARLPLVSSISDHYMIVLKRRTE
jgi:ubiquinone/menaquinone biosynthesis C-methylase UbiE